MKSYDPLELLEILYDFLSRTIKMAIYSSIDSNETIVIIVLNGDSKFVSFYCFLPVHFYRFDDIIY